MVDYLNHWKDTEFEIPNDFFSNKKEKGRDADGILDIFDRFNFTMNEDEPLEKEVAVDPEMLGKIFENLLEVSDRKSKGAFYTPREIVHYMCQESLINYLINEVEISYDDMKEFILYGELIRDADGRSDVRYDSNAVEYGRKLIIKESVINNIIKIDKALENVKVADPAVGSGAFPLGMLNEIVRARNNITEYLVRKDKTAEGIVGNGKKYGEKSIRHKRSLYELKWKTIKDSIFAVDIEPSAVDITKLRLWLSVVVDQEINKENLEPHPLPNLDMNIHAGNSLIDEYEGIKLFDKSVLQKIGNNNDGSSQLNLFKKTEMQLSLFTDHSDEMLDKMFMLQDRYFDENNEEKKKEIKVQIENIRNDLIRYKLDKNNNNDGLKKFEESLKNRSKPYFIWELEFAKIFKDKGGFDIVIGNPPYVKEYTNSNIFKPLKKSEYYQGKMDFWYFFGCIGLDLLKENGIECLIAPNNWITNSGASIIRNKIVTESEMLSFIDFGNFKVFDTAAIQTMIYIIRKNSIKIEYEANYSKLQIDKPDKQMITEFLYNKKNIKNISIKFKSVLNRTNLINKYITFIDNENNELLSKIKMNTERLDKSEIAQGIVAPQDILNKKNAKILGEKFKIGDGIFVLSNEEKNLAEFNSEEFEDVIKPYYTSNELSKYKCSDCNHKYILYCKSNMNKMIEKYPNVKKHLDKFISINTSAYAPYGLHRARNESFFTGEKILSIRKCSEPTFTYSN